MNKMWFKLEDESYLETMFSTILGVGHTPKTEVDPGGWHVQVVTPHTGAKVRKVRGGYLTKEEAQDALDEMMYDVEFMSIDADENDDSVEVEPTEEEEFVSYPDMTPEQLREELTTRGLPTDGRKNELVKRLSEDDAARETTVEKV